MAETVVTAPIPVERPSLSEIFLTAALGQGLLRDYSFKDPAIGHAHTVSEGETLIALARRFSPVMETENLEGVIKAIALHNGLLGEDGSGKWQDVRLEIGQQIYIPLPAGVEIHQQPFSRITTPEDLASRFNVRADVPDFMRFDPARAAKVLAALNPSIGADPAATVPYLYPAMDDFAGTVPLRPATGDYGASNVALIISEGNDYTKENPTDETHHEKTYAYAMNYGYFLNGGAEHPPIFSLRETTMGQLQDIIRGFGPSRPSDYLVFSQSYAYVSGASLNFNPAALNLQTVHFIAAGNDGNRTPGIRSMPAALESLGGRSYVVGAVHDENGVNVVADYSSRGADILAPPIATHDGKIETGTSFATPMMAALDREMLARYGGTLSQEEIMAAAFMSTDMNLRLGNGVYTPEMLPSDLPVVPFVTNGGGRPHNEFAGAGMIDPQRWQDNLEIMAKMKLRMEHQPAPINTALPLDTPEQRTNLLTGKPEYVYRVAITEDMTLDRLSFVLPQANRGDQRITVTSPSGFTYTIGDTVANAHATSAFALEDVKAGDTITITVPDTPLDASASMVLRGFGDGNVVQSLRDYLSTMGAMPVPNTSYAGTTPQSMPGLQNALENYAERLRGGLADTLSPPVDVLSNQPVPHEPLRPLPDLKL